MSKKNFIGILQKKNLIFFFRKLNAFIWDSPRLEYEAALDCDLVTVGELFGRSSYGIALRKQDAWVNPLSHAILSFHEKGFMELLDNQWIFSKQLKKLRFLYLLKFSFFFSY
jgi:ABC-type amino acid transport substrate-binding protein